jgi:hypothetical protein
MLLRRTIVAENIASSPRLFGANHSPIHGLRIGYVANPPGLRAPPAWRISMGTPAGRAQFSCLRTPNADL